MLGYFTGGVIFMHLNEFVTRVKVGMGMFEVNFETLKPMRKHPLNHPKQA